MHTKLNIFRIFVIAAILIFAASCTTNKPPANKPANEFRFIV